MTDSTIKGQDSWPHIGRLGGLDTGDMLVEQQAEVEAEKVVYTLANKEAYH